jgi:hypothetical protein
VAHRSATPKRSREQQLPSLVLVYLSPCLSLLYLCPHLHPLKLLDAVRFERVDRGIMISGAFCRHTIDGFIVIFSLLALAAPISAGAQSHCGGVRPSGLLAAFTRCAVPSWRAHCPHLEREGQVKCSACAVVQLLEGRSSTGR